MMGNYHVRCGAGEKSEVATPETHLSLFGTIPNFDKKLATFRSLRISSDIIVQSIAQLAEMYEDRQSKIISNCSITILLGSNDIDDCEWWSKQVGQTTVRSRSINIENKGLMQGSSGGSISDNAELLLRPESIRSMSGDQSLIIIQGELPIKDKKYKAIDHPRWDETKEPFEYERLFYIEQKKDAIPTVKLHVINPAVSQGPALPTRPNDHHPYSNKADVRTDHIPKSVDFYKQEAEKTEEELKARRANAKGALINLNESVNDKVIKKLDQQIVEGKATVDENNVFHKKSIADELAAFTDI